MYPHCCSVVFLKTVIIPFIYLLIIVFPTLHSTKLLFFKNEVDFTINNGEIKYPFTNVLLENVYEVEDDYRFLIPDVKIICNECVCVDRDITDCTDETHRNNHQCATLINSTTRCTIYNTFGKDVTICPNYYRMCCQVYFSKQKLSKIFIAFKLKYLESNLKQRIDFFRPVEINRNHNYLINYNIVYLYRGSDFPLLKDQWYFLEEGSTELLYSDELNTKQNIKLDKIGWFRFDEDRNEPLQVSLNSLKSHLQVKPVNCESNPPRYEWKLNANGYSSEGLLRQHSGVNLVSDTYKNSISFNKDENMIEIQAKFLPNVTPFLSINVSLLSFNFTSKIMEYPNCVNNLNVAFSKGNGEFIIKICNFDREEVYTSSTSIATASIKNPIEVIFPLKCKNYESSLVCVHQDDHEYCQSLEIIISRDWEYSLESTTLKAAKQSTITSTLIPLIPVIQDTQELSEHQLIWIQGIACGSFSTAILILVGFIIYGKWRKKSARRSQKIVKEL